MLLCSRGIASLILLRKISPRLSLVSSSSEKIKVLGNSGAHPLILAQLVTALFHLSAFFPLKT